MNILSNCYCELGESPVWNPIRNCYHWVDIIQQKIFTVDHNFEKIDIIEMPDKVGCVVVNKEGNLIAALSKEIVKVCLQKKEIKILYKPDISTEEMFNDGKVDAKGRFWLTSKHIKEDAPEAKLYCYDGLNFTCKDEGFIVGNGIGWSINNQWMYFTDSPKKIIYRYDYDLQRGDICNRKVFINVSRGYPDGLCVDSNNHIWSANWDGHCITHYNSDGEIQEIIELENARPTSCCFGGFNLDQLFITSAYVGLNNKTAKDGLCQILNGFSNGGNILLASIGFTH